MPIVELVGGLLSGITRNLGNFFAETVLEVLIKGLGYLICRPFSKTVDSEGIPVIFFGLVGWIVIAVILYLGYSYFLHQMDIDSCLDSGGRYDYAQHSCEFKNA